jgi:hypothetical protein
VLHRNKTMQEIGHPAMIEGWLDCENAPTAGIACNTRCPYGL